MPDFLYRLGLAPCRTTTLLLLQSKHQDTRSGLYQEVFYTTFGAAVLRVPVMGFSSSRWTHG